MPGNSPAITIILTCHNLAGFVTEAITSVRAQDFRDFEVLVIDDGSDDASSVEIEAAITDDPRFRLIRQAHQGLSVARNTGLDAARGAFIAFLDGDDRYAPGFLRCHLTAIQQSGADWTASALSLFWPDGRQQDHSAIHGRPFARGAPEWIDLSDARAIARLFPSAWNKLYRRALIGGTRFTPGALFEDHPFFWELACKSGRLRYLPQPLYHYRRGREGQITARADSAMFQQLDRLREVAGIIRDAPVQHSQAGLSRLATRLIHERLEPPAPASLKSDFLNCAAALMTDLGLRWDRAGGHDISPQPAPLLDPDLRLHVLLHAGPGEAQAATQAALSRQTLPVAQIEVIEGQGSIAAMLRALDSRQMAWVACLQAGDLPAPDWAVTCLETARACDALCVITAALHNGPRPLDDTGLALTDTALAAPDPAALMLHRDALQLLQAPLRAALSGSPDPVAACALAAHLSPRRTHTPRQTLQLGPRPLLDLRALSVALRDSPGTVLPLSPTDRSTVFAHLAQMQMARHPTRLARLGSALRAGLARRSAGLPAPSEATARAPILRLCLGGGQNSAGRSRK